jgi:hypothetical protein
MIDLLALLDSLTDALVDELMEDHSECGASEGERNVDVDVLETFALAVINLLEHCAESDCWVERCDVVVGA